MAVLDFTEIAQATGGADRDEFELFSRDLLQLIGFEVVQGPDRGPDGGRDLIVLESRTGITGETAVRWLVSCKHKAHSGASVTPGDEPDIHDRIATHECDGFLAVYSTLPSSGLAGKLNARRLGFETEVLDKARIEGILLSSPEGVLLARRYFPKSVGVWEKESPMPATLYKEPIDLRCCICGKSLLWPEPTGNVVIAHGGEPWNPENPRTTEAIYWCCKDRCDDTVTRRIRAEGLSDAWFDLPDIAVPSLFLKHILSTFRMIGEGEKYSPEALNSHETLVLNMFPLVSRHLTSEERQRISHLGLLPAYLGGLGLDDLDAEA